MACPRSGIATLVAFLAFHHYLCVFRCVLNCISPVPLSSMWDFSDTKNYESNILWTHIATQMTRLSTFSVDFFWATTACVSITITIIDYNGCEKICTILTILWEHFLSKTGNPCIKLSKIKKEKWQILSYNEMRNGIEKWDFSLLNLVGRMNRVWPEEIKMEQM